MELSHGNVRWFTKDVVKFLEEIGSLRDYDAVFIDPPYATRASAQYTASASTRYGFRSIAEQIGSTVQKDCVVFSCEYPHNHARGAALLPFIHRYSLFLVPRHDSTMEGSRILKKNEQPSSFVEEIMCLSVADSFDGYKMRNPRHALRQASNLFYRYRRPANRTTHTECLGAKTNEIVLACLAAHIPTTRSARVLDLFAGSGTVWKACTQLAQHNGFPIHVDCVDSDPEQKKNFYRHYYGQTKKETVGWVDGLPQKLISTNATQRYYARWIMVLLEFLKENLSTAEWTEFQERCRDDYHTPEHIPYSHVRAMADAFHDDLPGSILAARLLLVSSPTMKVSLFLEAVKKFSMGNFDVFHTDASSNHSQSS